MKYLPNYFRRGQLRHLSFCYPDPHWKRKNHRRRIIQTVLVHEYAYVLRPGGLLYTVSDVKELEDWMIEHLDASPLFERLTEEEAKADPVLEYVVNSSEDAVRSEKKKLQKHYAVHRRRPDPPVGGA